MRAPLIFMIALFVTATVAPASAANVLLRIAAIHDALSEGRERHSPATSE